MNRNFDNGSPESKAPAFGEAVPIVASPETLRFLARRRSASAVNLGAPGPTDREALEMLTMAARVPDHGKLAPWRFILFGDAAKARFVARLEAIATERPDGVRLQAKLAKLRAPPLTIAVVSRHVAGEIPEWEQRLSAGAVCMTLLNAAQAMGFGANWITDWYAYDPDALALLGLAEGERVAGFVHVGTATEEPLERVRPDVEELASVWGA